MDWKSKLADAARIAAENVEEFVDVAWRRFYRQMGLNEAQQIVAYRGYGNAERLWIHGRLLANKPYGGPQDDDNWWDNLQATYQRWESDELPGEDIRLACGSSVQIVTTDEEGYYEASFEVETVGRHQVFVTATHEPENPSLTADHRVTLVNENAEFMVISDVDDTIIHTGITNLLLAAQLTFLNNAKTRKPLTGVGSLYRSLAKGMAEAPINPVFYLSNSGWNMYDLLRDFLDLNDLPPGPLLLRDLGLGNDTSDHKIQTLRHLFDRIGSLPVILVGDSGQHDAEIYARIAEEYPDRVRTIYIREIDPGDDSDYDRKVDRAITQSKALGIPFLRVQDSARIAHHAAGIGLLPAARVSEIEAEVKADRQRD